MHPSFTMQNPASAAWQVSAQADMIEILKSTGHLSERFAKPTLGQKIMLNSLSHSRVLLGDWNARVAFMVSPINLVQPARVFWFCKKFNKIANDKKFLGCWIKEKIYKKAGPVKVEFLREDVLRNVYFRCPLVRDSISRIDKTALLFGTRR